MVGWPMPERTNPIAEILAIDLQDVALTLCSSAAATLHIMLLRATRLTNWMRAREPQASLTPSPSDKFVEGDPFKRRQFKPDFSVRGQVDDMDREAVAANRRPVHPIFHHPLNRRSGSLGGFRHGRTDRNDGRR